MTASPLDLSLPRIKYHQYVQGKRQRVVSTRIEICWPGQRHEFLPVSDFRLRYGKDEAAMKRLAELTGGKA